MVLLLLSFITHPCSRKLDSWIACRQSKCIDSTTKRWLCSWICFPHKSFRGWNVKIWKNAHKLSFEKWNHSMTRLLKSKMIYYFMLELMYKYMLCMFTLCDCCQNSVERLNFFHMENPHVFLVLNVCHLAESKHLREDFEVAFKIFCGSFRFNLFIWLPLELHWAILSQNLLVKMWGSFEHFSRNEFSIWGWMVVFVILEHLINPSHWGFMPRD